MKIMIDNGFGTEDTVIEDIKNGLRVQVGDAIFTFSESLADNSELSVYNFSTGKRLTVRPRSSNSIVLSLEKQ